MNPKDEAKEEIVLSDEWNGYFNALVRDCTASGSIPKSEARRRILKLSEMATEQLRLGIIAKARKLALQEAVEVMKESKSDIKNKKDDPYMSGVDDGWQESKADILDRINEMMER